MRKRIALLLVLVMLAGCAPFEYGIEKGKTAGYAIVNDEAKYQAFRAGVLAAVGAGLDAGRAMALDKLKPDE